LSRMQLQTENVKEKCFAGRTNMFDILIKNGRIIDGTGSPSYLSDVAIKDGKIVKVARGIKGDAQKVIDARGLTITPGFIDSHSHSDGAIIKAPGQREKVEQGITTAITCQCGNSPAPISRDAVRDEYDVIEGVGSLYDIQKDSVTMSRKQFAAYCNINIRKERTL